MAPRFRKLTNEMLVKIEFWTIHGKMGVSTQYNLLVALFPNNVINKKDLSNAIQRFKKKVKPDKNDACQMLTELYLKKEEDPRWIIKPRFDYEERRLNSLFWMSPDQIDAYEKYQDIIIVDTTSKTNQFDMILMLIIAVDNNFRNIVDDSYQQEMARKDDYDQPQSLFSSLIENIAHNSIRQVWKVTRHRGQKSEPQYVILLDDGSHLCTCLWLINRGIFHISLIPQRWYNYNKYNTEQHKEPIYQIEENELDEMGPGLSFQHLANFRKTPNIVQSRGPKQKYGFGMSYAKKALDIAPIKEQNKLKKIAFDPFRLLPTNHIN
ncbi:hypothetical protein RhiirA4_507429 [Rhizophagus irregularis]|uniref:Uncharacterized protein n=1 Tax=Rhizophagus irregularis TaxID=588596 RepID=A0A2I1G878_9GLOM|nr:hypothetical protein RhiirA4_507429 [Rhizophagus irregularis]